MRVDVDPDALVIRFRPTAPDSVLDKAKIAKRVYDRYLLSVFADAAKQGETDDDLRARLLVASELGGIKLSGQKKYFECTKAKKLLDLGFTFWKDGDEDEVDEHYSVDLGEEPTIDDVRRFLSAFDSEGVPLR